MIVDVGRWKQEFQAKGWWHSFELPDGRLIEGVCSVEGLRNRIRQFPIPEDLRGARVLDIGAWDGWYSFEMERRGADVVAIDCWKNPRFRQMHHALRSTVRLRLMDFYDLTPATVGRFDIVLFMGVLYHLKHPLLALERVCALATDLAAVDSFVLRDEHLPGADIESRPVMEFYETEEFGGQSDNWCGPTVKCLIAMCRTAGFARVEHRATLPTGACIACYRKWEPAPAASEDAPELLYAIHHTSFGINFDSRRDEYVSAFFRTPDDCRPESIRPLVGPYGSHPVHLSRLEPDSWQVNFKLPPGLTPGWHNVTLASGASVPSAPVRIAVDVPFNVSSLTVERICDGTTWETGALDLSRGNVLTVWLHGLPENADRGNVTAALDGDDAEVVAVIPGRAGKATQLNLLVPRETAPGLVELEISAGGRSQWVVFRVRL
jgi:tRNA (mo5U34)-methyltransferase